MLGTWFCLPLNNENTLCRVEDSRIVPIRPLPAPLLNPAADEWRTPQRPPYAVSSSGYVAWFHDGSSHVEFTHADAGPEDSFPPLEFPDGQEVMSLSFAGDVLQVATDAGRSQRCWIFDPASSRTGPVPVVLPEDNTDFADLLLSAGRLFVLRTGENGVWVDVYTINEKAEPTFQKTATCERRSNCEAGELLAVNDRTLAVLSRGWGFAENVNYLTLFDLESLQPCGAWANTVQASMLVYGWQPPSPAPIWHSLTWAGDRVILAAGEAGVGVIRSDGPTYLPLSGAVVHVEPVPGSQDILAVVAMGKGLDTVLVRPAVSESGGSGI
jgi:hypothetical protein